MISRIDISRIATDKAKTNLCCASCFEYLVQVDIKQYALYCKIAKYSLHSD